MTMITLTTGTAFIMWVGEQITERGIGNGISLIIFAGIVTASRARRSATSRSDEPGRHDRSTSRVILAIVLVVIAAIVFFERGQRQIPIHYAKRVVGRKIYGGQTAHLPLKVNTAGTIPPIFASSLLMFPAQLAGFVGSAGMQKFSERAAARRLAASTSSTSR